LTYQQAASLPAFPDGIAAAIRDHLKAGANPPATLVLRQLGYLLAVAPLTDATRTAAWNMLAGLPGLHLCGNGNDLSGRRGQGICVDTKADETEILVDPAVGSVLAVEERIREQSVMYPAVAAGSLIGSDTFVDIHPGE
jgi:hypothetical protein